MLRTTGNGFHMTFANGWTASVQWNLGNYCANRERAPLTGECMNAEVAAWKSGEDYKFNSKSNCIVEGWCTPEKVVEFLATIAKL